MEKREPMLLDIDGDLLFVKTGDSCYVGNILSDSLGYFIDIQLCDSAILFSFAGIKDKIQFQREILGYSSKIGNSPYCRTREDVIKLVVAIVGYSNNQLNSRGFLSLRKRKNIKFNFNL